MRGSGLSLLALLAGCGPAEPQPVDGAQPNFAAECAIAGAAAFEPVCTIEPIETEEGPGLVVRAPGGSFRRFLVTDEGRSVETADGAEPAFVTALSDGRIEVVVAGDRYRFDPRAR